MTEKKEQKPNNQRYFFQKKYKATSKTSFAISIFFTLVFLALNIIALYKQIVKTITKEDGADFKQSKQFIDLIKQTEESKLVNLFKDEIKTGSCKTCLEVNRYFNFEYYEQAKNSFKITDFVNLIETIKPIGLIGITILSAIAMVYMFLNELDSTQIYVDFKSLFCDDFNVNIYLQHFFKFTQNTKSTNLKVIFKEMILPTFLIATVIYQTIIMTEKCKGAEDLTEISNKLIQKIKDAQQETGLSENQLFNIQVIFPIEYLRDTNLSCEGKQVVKEMFSNFWSVFVQSQFIKSVLEAIYIVVTVYLNKASVKNMVLYYTINAQETHLIAQPDEQEEEKIPFYLEQQEQDQQNKQISMKKIDTRVYPEQNNDQQILPIQSNKIQTATSLNNLTNQENYPILKPPAARVQPQNNYNQNFSSNPFANQEQYPLYQQNASDQQRFRGPQNQYSQNHLQYQNKPNNLQPKK